MTKINNSVFGKVGDAQASAGGNYFTPGKYTVKIVKCLTKRSQMKGNNLWISEFKVVDTNNPKHAIGSTASHVINLDNVAGPSNVKAFIAAASGVDPFQDNETVNEQLQEKWREATGQTLSIPEICALITDEEQNPLADIELELECFLTKTRAGGDFTKHVYKALGA